MPSFNSSLSYSIDSNQVLPRDSAASYVEDLDVRRAGSRRYVQRLGISESFDDDSEMEVGANYNEIVNRQIRTWRNDILCNTVIFAILIFTIGPQTNYIHNIVAKEFPEAVYFLFINLAWYLINMVILLYAIKLINPNNYDIMSKKVHMIQLTSLVIGIWGFTLIYNEKLQNFRQNKESNKTSRDDKN